jgi:hypothetical protein
MKKLNKLILLITTICSLNSSAQTIPSYVSTIGLVGWWPFNGNAIDESINTNDGTVYGSTLIADRFGSPNSAYSFNAPLNNRIVVPNSPGLNPNLISVSIWVNPTVFGPSEQYIIDKSIDLNPGSVNRSWAIRIGGSGELDLEIRVNNIYYSFPATSTLSINQWNNLVFVYDGITAKLYKDNIVVISQSLPGTLTNFNYNLSIGYFPHTSMPPFGYFWNGKLDDIGIWNRALTRCEISQLYNGSVLPTPTISASNSVICAGGSAILTASTSATTYTWNTGATTMSISVSPTVTSTYTLTGTNTLGCIAPAVVTVTVNALPTVTANSGTICAGSSFTISGSGANTYTYSSGSAVVSPTVNTNYSVTGTSSLGCVSSNTAVATITVNALPTVSVTSGAICAGGSYSMTPSGANTYTYSGGSAVVSPTANTSYSITGTSSFGCVSSNTAVATITVNALPTVSVTSGAICAGGSYSMTPSGANTYTYSGGSAVVSPTANTSYSITGTSSFGCVSSNTAVATVTVNALPTVTANSGTICSGNSFTISGSGAITYTYSSGSVVNPTATETYTVSGTSTLGCISSALSSVTVNANPTVTASSSNSLICVGNNAVLTASTTATSYTWNNGATTMSVSVSPTVTSTYTVSVSNAAACIASSTVMVTVDACSGINEAIANSISIYPNPNNGLFTIELKETTQVIITNILGHILLNSTLHTGKQILDIKNNANGIYFVQLIKDGKQQTIKLVKE